MFRVSREEAGPVGRIWAELKFDRLHFAFAFAFAFVDVGVTIEFASIQSSHQSLKRQTVCESYMRGLTKTKKAIF